MFVFFFRTFRSSQRKRSARTYIYVVFFVKFSKQKTNDEEEEKKKEKERERKPIMMKKEVTHTNRDIYLMNDDRIHIHTWKKK